LKALITAIMNEDRKQEFIAKFEKKHGAVDDDDIDYLFD